MQGACDSGAVPLLKSRPGLYLRFYIKRVRAIQKKQMQAANTISFNVFFSSQKNPHISPKQLELLNNTYSMQRKYGTMGPPAHAKENTWTCLACNNGPNQRKLEAVVSTGCAGGSRGKWDGVAVPEPGGHVAVVPRIRSACWLALPLTVSPSSEA